jgi:hypothetical protein
MAPRNAALSQLSGRDWRGTDFRTDEFAGDHYLHLFCCRLSAVSLEATNLVLPKPLAVTELALNDLYFVLHCPAGRELSRRMECLSRRPIRAAADLGTRIPLVTMYRFSSFFP